MAPFCGTEHFRLRYLTLHVARVKESGLAFRNWFHKPKPAQEHVPGPRILVCSLDPRFSETVIADHKVYGRFFPDSTAAVLDNIHELLDFVGRGYDILHLLCDVSAAGFIRDLRDQTISGTELIDACLAANVKLLWFASDNPFDGYRNFDLKYARLNVVMTLERKGEKFPRFLILFAPHPLCRSLPLTAQQTPWVFGNASCCAAAFRCSPASTGRSSRVRRPDR